MDNESKSDRLLRTLVVNEPELQVEGGEKVSFINAMQQLGMASVFDIIAQPKSHFVQRLGEICEADGEVAYENAMCYAVQIGRLYREYQVSSGTAPGQGHRTGVRALVDIGPSYPNLFKENWDSFCQVGAMAAIDSPVAYLSSLYRFATRTLEHSGQGIEPKILLGTRRPDIADLIIDQHSTFTPRPMLEVVNEILKADITRYRADKPNPNTPIYDLLAERRYPFMFPYNFPHHQCRLGLAEKKLELGELNYRISRQLPLSPAGGKEYGAVQTTPAQAQCWMSGLSPQQQQLLIEPSLFTTFNLSNAELNGAWKSPGTSHLSPHTGLRVGFLMPPGQRDIKSVVPQAHTLVASGYGTSTTTLEFSKRAGSATGVVFWFNSSTPGNAVAFWALNYLHPANTSTLCTVFRPENIQPLPIDPGAYASFTITTTTSPNVTPPVPVPHASLSFTIVLDENVTWTAPQQAFFQDSYGLKTNTERAGESLVALQTFMLQTQLDAEQVEALLSQRTHFPRLSPNCPSTNPQARGSGTGRPYPHASHYGACYVNGHGSERYDSVVPATVASERADQFDNAMGLKEVRINDRSTWYLTKTSPNRFDRLQRMIRLQRWLDIPFAQLDTLLICAIRSEGEHNLGMDLNINSLRTLGVYRYLSRRYSIQPEEFAAFLHHLTPYATGDRVPLFDQVFNRSALFDAPLVLNQIAFNPYGTDVVNKKTVAQLCAGLGVQATQSSFLRMAEQTQVYLGPLRRDLGTVSSLYRQARIPQMFGLSPEDGWGLVDLLGGTDYQRLLCTGRLRSASLAGSVAVDILDVLMQLDWAVNWLKDSKQTVAGVRRALGLDPGDYLPPQGLVDRLGTLAAATREALLTDEQISALNLPMFEHPKSPGAREPINWREVLQLLLDPQGLVMPVPLKDIEDPHHYLRAALEYRVGKLNLSDQEREESVTKLATLLLAGHDRQLRLIEGLAQEMINLPMDRTQIVLRWAKTSVHTLLSAVLGMATSDATDALISQLQRVLRYGQVVMTLGLSTSALRVFLINPSWLGAPGKTLELSLNTLYLLSRYTLWFYSQSQAEEALLGYFIAANPAPAAVKNKALRSRVNDDAASVLAGLLGWQQDEIRTLFQLLPNKRACSMADVDWIQRCRATSMASGLAPADLLEATALHDGSTSAAWQAVGQAVMATSR